MRDREFVYKREGGEGGPGGLFRVRLIRTESKEKQEMFGIESEMKLGTIIAMRMPKETERGPSRDLRGHDNKTRMRIMVMTMPTNIQVVSISAVTVTDAVYSEQDYSRER
jgi:hypothetical protein